MYTLITYNVNVVQRRHNDRGYLQDSITSRRVRERSTILQTPLSSQCILFVHAQAPRKPLLVTSQLLCAYDTYLPSLNSYILYQLPAWRLLPPSPPLIQRVFLFFFILILTYIVLDIIDAVDNDMMQDKKRQKEPMKTAVIEQKKNCSSFPI